MPSGDLEAVRFILRRWFEDSWLSDLSENDEAWLVEEFRRIQREGPLLETFDDLRSTYLGPG